MMKSLKKRKKLRRKRRRSKMSPVSSYNDYSSPSIEYDFPFGVVEEVLVGFKEYKIDDKKIIAHPLNSSDENLDNFYELVDTLFSEDDLSTVPSYLIKSKALQASCVVDSDKYHHYVKCKIESMMSDILSYLSICMSSHEIGTFWHEVSLKINLITTILSPLCRKAMNLDDFKKIAFESITNMLLNSKDVLKEISDIIISDYHEARASGETSDIKTVFQFFKEIRIFDQAFIPILFDSISMYFQPIFDNSFESYHLDDYLKYTSELINMEKNYYLQISPNSGIHQIEKLMIDLAFVNNIEKIYKSEDIINLIINQDFKTLSLMINFAIKSNQSKAIAECLAHKFEYIVSESIKTKDNPMLHILTYLSSMQHIEKMFISNNESISIIHCAFERGLNINSETVAKLLAEEIHCTFTKNPYHNKIDEFIILFRMICAKDIFEVVHHILLTRRILQLKIAVAKNDDYFITALRKQCGPEYTKRFDSLLSDLRESIDLNRQLKKKDANMTQFNKTDLKSSFKVVMLSKSVWKEDRASDVVLPRQVEEWQNFFVSNVCQKREIIWKLELTRVRLAVKNILNLKEINCNGLQAVIFLEFNNRKRLSTEYLKKYKKFTQKEIDSALCPLIKKKYVGYNILTNKGSRLEINKKISSNSKTNVVRIPFIIPSIENINNIHNMKNDILMIRRERIDANIIHMMKEKRFMEKDDLIESIKNNINQESVDNLLIEKELLSLAKKEFIRIDETDRVCYVP